METSTENKCEQVISTLAATYTEAGCVDLTAAANVVRSHTGTLIPLVKPKSYCIRVCGQDDTVYAGNEDQLEAWKDWYLPDRMEMEVIGAIDDFPCDAFGLQLVLLLCEDGKIYAYEDEVLHLVARNVRELVKDGMTFPGIESFKQGECFEDISEEEYNEMVESQEIREVKEAHKEFRESLERELLESLIKVAKESAPPKNSDTIKGNQEIVPKGNQEIVPWCKTYVIISPELTAFTYHLDQIPREECKQTTLNFMKTHICGRLHNSSSCHTAVQCQ